MAVIDLFFLSEGREDPEKRRIWFTIITNCQDTGKGYIIMDIMLIRVTNNTRYRGEKCLETAYFGV